MVKLTHMFNTESIDLNVDCFKKDRLDFGW